MWLSSGPKPVRVLTFASGDPPRLLPSPTSSTRGWLQRRHRSRYRTAPWYRPAECQGAGPRGPNTECPTGATTMSTQPDHRFRQPQQGRSTSSTTARRLQHSWDGANDSIAIASTQAHHLDGHRALIHLGLINDAAAMAQHVVEASFVVGNDRPWTHVGTGETPRRTVIQRHRDLTTPLIRPPPYSNTSFRTHLPPITAS